MLSTNQTLHKGRYRVINQFTTDSGNGMYEAYDTVSDSNVVLKECLSPQAKVSTPSQREASDSAFFGAAKKLSALKHSSLVSVHDYFSDIGRQYLVLEAVEGFDLNKYLDPASDRPELSVVLKWADQLLNALHFLHKLAPPVIHGDIRPENIRFTSQGDVKLLTAQVNSNGAVSTKESSSNYQPFEKVWLGLDSSAQESFLKDYDARAERLLRGPADARSDLYSVGACIYQLLAGLMPVDSLERAVALRDKKPDPLKKLADVASGIPIEISDAVMKALEIKREFRFYSAAVMAQVLRTAVVKVAERLAEGGNAVQPEGSEPVVQTVESTEVLTDSFVHAIPDFAPTGADARQRELEEEQLKLEAEQKRIEERRQAIGAERARLEHEAELERQRIEQERRAEEKRLLEAKAEEERVNAANRLAQLEAEKKKHLLEAERQEQEAEQERLRAEKKLAELHAERERQLEEEHKEAAAVREELERAEQRLLELSHLDTPAELLASSDPLEDDLLELDSSIASVSAVPKALEVLADKPFEGFGPTKQIAEPDFAFQDFDSTSKFSWKIPAIGAAVAALVIVVLGWTFLGSSEPTPSTAIEVQTSAPVTEANPQPAENVVTIEQPVAVPGQSPVTEQPTVEAYSTDREVDLSPQQKRAPNESLKAAEKPKKVARTAANKPTPKKLTVDDLINDN